MERNRTNTGEEREREKERERKRLNERMKENMIGIYSNLDYRHNKKHLKLSSFIDALGGSQISFSELF